MNLLEIFKAEVPVKGEVPERPMGREAVAASGQWALRRVRLAMLAAERESFSNILDMGCADGRVLRVLQAAFPEARLTACDIDHGDVDYCVEKYGAIPLYSQENVNALEIREPFDLIWCCSLLTHFDKAQWADFLGWFQDHLVPGGLVVFTVHGAFVAELIRARAAHGQRLSEERAEEILFGYDTEGFGFSARYDSKGLAGAWSLSKPSWVCARIEEHAPKLDLLTYTVGGWAPRWGGDDNRRALATADQDVVSCIRTI